MPVQPIPKYIDANVRILEKETIGTQATEVLLVCYDAEMRRMKHQNLHYVLCVESNVYTFEIILVQMLQLMSICH